MHAVEACFQIKGSEWMTGRRETFTDAGSVWGGLEPKVPNISFPVCKNSFDWHIQTCWRLDIITSLTILANIMERYVTCYRTSGLGGCSGRLGFDSWHGGRSFCGSPLSSILLDQACQSQLLLRAAWKKVIVPGAITCIAGMIIVLVPIFMVRQGMLFNAIPLGWSNQAGWDGRGL
jgi:hypothetical protein